jgi:hypothetical protein
MEERNGRERAEYDIAWLERRVERWLSHNERAFGDKYHPFGMIRLFHSFDVAIRECEEAYGYNDFVYGCLMCQYIIGKCGEIKTATNNGINELADTIKNCSELWRKLKRNPPECCDVEAIDKLFESAGVKE